LDILQEYLDTAQEKG
jgi:hypothetical protein